jgi:vacuolar-type H+-ATPase subunit H
MKIFKLMATGLLLLLNTSVFAEQHADEALKHARKSAEATQGEAKNHIDEGVKSLESAIEHGKQEHTEVATEAAEEAVKHLTAGNK